MTSGHPLIPDSFYLLAGLLFLAKFLTWEEARQQDPKKRTIIIIVGTLITLIIVGGAIFGNHKLNAQLSPALTKEEIASEVWRRAPTHKTEGTNGLSNDTRSNLSKGEKRDKEPHQPIVGLIFKDSPGFSDERKRIIQETIDSYYSYLVTLGLDPPKDLPPISIRKGGTPYMGGAFGHTPLNGGVTMGSESGRAGPVVTYGDWAFMRLLEPTASYDRQMYWTTIKWTVSEYFDLVFLEEEKKIPSWVAFVTG